MESYLLSGFLGFVMVNMLCASGRRQVSFSQNYNVGWGSFIQLQITTPKSYLHWIKAQLTSKETRHDEIDFEFIGTNGPPYELSTNPFTKGVRGREQTFHLWFDPTTDFHSHKILWNQYQVVFFVDKVPIRVFKNLGNEGNCPTQGMQVEGSLRDAGRGLGRSTGPRPRSEPRFQGFDINGCVVSDALNPGSCDYTHGGAWAQNQTLNAAQLMQHQNARSKYLNYDYCKDRSRYAQPPPECHAQIGIRVNS